MAYVDLAATEARGRYSPPNGNDPQTIPDLWRPAPGEEIRTDLPDLTDAELNALDWKGPIQMPPFAGTSYFTHDYEWNSETISFDATELDEYEKQRRVNYDVFCTQLIDTEAYNTIKETSTESLIANTLATEFIAFISDAKNGKANVQKIQQSLHQILVNIPFSDSELAEIQEVFTQSGMFAVYTLA